MRTVRLWPLFLAAVFSLPAAAQFRDVTFFVIGKHANYDQLPNGRLENVDYSFFSEIFLRPEGDASQAYLVLPSGEQVYYKDQRYAEGGARDNLFLISGKSRYTRYNDLQADYPDGQYRVAFATPSGSVPNGLVAFKGDQIPKAPRIELFQYGQKVRETVDAERDLKVTWSPFSQGAEDPRRILDDLIFVILRDSNGRKVAHSGRPFEGRPYLNYSDLEYRIPAELLEPGQCYMLSVEHAALADTRQYGGVTAMSTKAVTTRLQLRTATKNGARPVCAQQAQSSGNVVSNAAVPSVDSQVVMLYYRELAAADQFYGEYLGLPRTMDLDWVKFFQIGPAATVGLIREGDGAYHPVRPRSSVMLSIVTSEVDAWYARLKANSEIVFLKEISENQMIRSFLIEDPGGYTVEFFQWVDRP